MSKFNLDNLSNSNTQLDCWLEDGSVDIVIKINKQAFHIVVGQEKFFNKLIPSLEVMNVSSFIIVIYSEGDVNAWSTSVNELKEKLPLWEERDEWQGEDPRLQDIDEILKLN